MQRQLHTLLAGRSRLDWFASLSARRFCATWNWKTFILKIRKKVDR